MLKPAKEATNVKFLVTSQDPDLCRGLHQVRINESWKSIQMEAASLSDATKILVHHMFYPEDEHKPGDIPKDTQVCIDEIIEFVGRNLLAIACVGAACFDSEEFYKLEKWEEMKDELTGWLNGKSRAGIQNIDHPLSFEAALEFAFKRLKDDERRLLFLIALCRQSSVPQLIIQYLYKLTKDEVQYQAFLDAMRTLSGRQFVQRHDDRFSVHSMLKEFLIRKFNQEYQKRILDAISKCKKKMEPDDDEKDILSAISNLYFQDSDFAKRIAEKVNSEALDDMANNDVISTVRTIEPILVLAVKEVKKDWTREMQSNSRQVFWNYIRSTVLDDKGTEFLLRQACSKREMIIAVCNIAFDARSFKKLGLQNIFSKQVLLALLEILTEEQIYDDFRCGAYDKELRLLFEVISVIHFYLWPDKDTITDSKKLCQDPNFCACATRALQKFIEFLVSKPNLSVEILMCFCSLSPLISLCNICLETVNMRGAMQRIVSTVLQCQNEDVEASASACGAGKDIPCLQESAIASLVAPIALLFISENAPDPPLGCGRKAFTDYFNCFGNKAVRDYCYELSNVEGASETLVHAVAQSNTLDQAIQQAALPILTSMVMLGGQDVLLNIYKSPTSMSNLLKAMGRKGASDLQRNVAFFLMISVEFTGEADFCPTIAIVNGAAQALVDALAASNPEVVRQTAAHLLQVLASYGGEDLCEEICRASGSISNLLNAMGEKGDPEIQEDAAFILVSLLDVASEADFCLKICAVNGATQVLVDALAASNPQDVQRVAANILWVLALYGGKDFCEEIYRASGSIPNLLNAMDRKGDPDMQGTAAYFLMALLEVANETDFYLKICAVNGAMQVLVNALAASIPEDVQGVAAGILRVLAFYGRKDLCEEICRASGSISNLLNAMGRKGDPALQEATASILVALLEVASKGDFCLKICAVNGAVQVLVDALAASNPQDVQEVAALILRVLAFYGGKDLCEEICRASGSIPNLVIAMRLRNLYDAGEVLLELAENVGRDYCQNILSTTGVKKMLCDGIAGEDEEAKNMAFRILAALLCRHSW